MAGNKFGSGIPLATGFDLNADNPLDHRQVKSTIEEGDKMSTELYVGLMVYVEQTKLTYQCKQLNPVKWELIGGNVKSGDGLSGSVDDDNVLTISHGSKPESGAPANSQLDEGSSEVITSVNVDKYGHVVNVNKKTLYAQLTWERLCALFNSNGFKLDEGTLTASELYADNLVTYDSGNPTLVEGVEDPVEARDPNSMVQITWSQIVSLFNSHGFELKNGTLKSTLDMNGDNLVTYKK